jgi:hypothetical protein
MKNLELWTEYSREEIHGIFSPETKFTPQAGTWGMHGIIPVPNREGDWVFIVTYGNKQGDHTFDESITEDGVLSWQSQPRMDFKSAAIQSFINHDDRINNIYLFLRVATEIRMGILVDWVTLRMMQKEKIQFIFSGRSLIGHLRLIS